MVVVRPLEGVRVVDLAEGRMAAIGRILADLGADVRIRRIPAPAAADDIDARLSRRLLEIGKSAIDLDPSDPAAVARIVADADILVADGGPLSALPVDLAALQRVDAALTILSVTNFGIDSPFAHFEATDPVLHALSGELARSGIKGRAPLLPPGYLGTASAATQAVCALLIAFHCRLRTGKGEFIDFSVLDGACNALDPGFGVAGSAFQGRRPTDLPRHRPPRGTYYPIIRCRDGRVRMCVLAVRQWRSLFAWMGEPAEFADPKYDGTYARLDSAELLAAVSAFFADKSCGELEAEGEARGIPISAVLSLDDALRSVHVRARGSMTDLNLGDLGDATVPSGCIDIDGERLPPRHEALSGGPRWVPSIKAGAAAARPLDDLKILDLGVIVAGAETGRLFGDQGADVAKIESSAYPDGQRQTRTGDPISNSVAAGQRNKRSVGLNLRSPEGRKLFFELAAKADVILSNFKPGTLEALGIDHGVVSAINPRIVMVESSAFGDSGPWSRRMGYGPLVRASSGLTDRWRYGDDADGHSDSVTVYPDHISGRYAFIAAMALVIRRARTGTGGKASVSQLDAIFGHAGEEIARISRGLPEMPPRAPWGVYPCLGDDEWCVITLRDDADWRSLVGVEGLAALDRPSRATNAGRLADSAAIDAQLTAWTRAIPPEAVMRLLQASGVPAAQMLRVPELPGHPHFVQRRFFRTEVHPLLSDPFIAESSPARFALLPAPPTRPAPIVGEQTVEVMREWLGLGADEIDRLLRAGVLEAHTDAASNAA